MVALLAVARVAEDRRDGDGDGLDLRGTDKERQALGEIRLRREAAADVGDEAHLPLALGRHEGEVVDAREAGIVRVRRDGDLELARQVRKGAVAEEELEDFFNDRARVEELLRIDAGQRIAENRARHVAAGLDGAKAHSAQARQDVYGVAQRDVVDLHGLTDRNLELALAVLRGERCKHLGLLRRQLARRQLDAHEEVAVARPLCVDARPLEALDIARVNVLEGFIRKGRDLLDDLEPVLIVLPLLIAIGKRHTISPI